MKQSPPPLPKSPSPQDKKKYAKKNRRKHILFSDNCKEEATQGQQYSVKLYCWHLEVVLQNIFLDTGKFIGKLVNRLKK